MTTHPVKRLALALAPKLEDLDLASPDMAGEEAPISSTEADLVCPACGELASATQLADDAEVEHQDPSEVGYPAEPTVVTVALCQACGCEFPPVGQPMTAQAVVIETLTRRSARLRRAGRMEALEDNLVRSALLR